MTRGWLVVSAAFPMAVAAIVVAWVVTGAVALARDHGVNIVGLAFAPSSLTVDNGDTVTWSNGDTVSHTVTADNGTFDTGTIAAGATASVTFSVPGTFAYHCTIHPSMVGTVIVRTASADGTPPPTEAAPEPGRPTDGGLPIDAVVVVLAAAALVGVVVGRRRFGSSASG
jgi:plastocyanin